MEILIIQGLTALVTAIISASVTYFFWLKKKDKEKDEANIQRLQIVERAISDIAHKVEDVETRSLEMEKRSISEPRVRQIVSEEISTIKEEILGVKTIIQTVTTTLQDLRVDLGVLNYIKDRERN